MIRRFNDGCFGFNVSTAFLDVEWFYPAVELPVETCFTGTNRQNRIPASNASTAPK
jgi:hypothetical protein